MKRGWMIAALLLVALLGWQFLPRRSSLLSSREARLAWLSSLGYIAEGGSEEVKQVLIPDCSEGLMADYNRLLLEQGYDLRPYEGKELTQFSYRILNFADGEPSVYATLYLYKNELVAADLHSAALNGFLHALGPR